MRALALLLLLSGCAAAPPARAPGPAGDEAAALAVVQRLFDAMRAGDAAGFLALLHPEADFLSVLGGAGGAVLERGDLEEFARAVGAPREEVWDERIRNPVVLVDGDLAAVWVEYAFFAGDRFSHCGVDAVHLVRGAEGWRIFHLVDTRRQEPCEGW